MPISNGLNEAIELIDQNGDNIENLFGPYNSAAVIIDESNRVEYSIGNDGRPADISDGPVENRATITCKPETLEILKVMGTFDSGAGTITFDKFLPKLNELNIQTTDSHRFHFENLKFGGFNLGAEIDSTVTIEFAPIHAETGQKQQQTVSVSNADGKPLQWTDTTVKIDGSQFGITESVAGDTLDRNINPEYGLGQGREPVEIVEGQFSIQPSFVVKVQDAEPWKKVLDDTNFPLTVQDVRSVIGEISFDFGDGNGELVIKNGKAEIDTYDLDEEKDTRTVELSFNAENIEVRNL
jgi:hypothetical protein